MNQNNTGVNSKDESRHDVEQKSESLWKKGVQRDIEDPVKASKDICNLGIPVYILFAGRDWEWFDYELGLERLIDLGDAEVIYDAGMHWPEFNYEKGLHGLIRTGDTEFIFRAGRYWKVYNYEVG